MKNVTFTFLITCLLTISLFSQSDKGRITLGGGVNFSSITDETDPASAEETTSTLSLIPQIGYYISDGVKIGIGIGYNSYNFEHKPGSINGTTEEVTRTSFVINPFVRFYVPASERVDLFIQGNFSYESRNEEFKQTQGTVQQTSEGSGSAIGIFLTPGIEYRISQRISLDLSVGQMGYFTESFKPDGTPTVESTRNQFKFDFNLSTVMLGVNIFL